MDWLGHGWSTISDWWVAAAWPWMSGWMQTPGFAGFAAVVAAFVAFLGVRHQARLNAWWQRMEWALNLYTGRESTQVQRMAGLAAIGEAQQSGLARKAEQRFVSAVITAVTLDPLGDGDERDDWGDSVEPSSSHGPAVAEESYSDPEAKEENDDQERDRAQGGPSGSDRV